MAKKNYDLVCLGEMLIDLFGERVQAREGEVEAFLPKPGGAPANVAVAARRLGLRSAFIGKLGQDAFGASLADLLEREGVETRGLCYDSQARTTLAVIAAAADGSPLFTFYRNPGADQMLDAEDLDRELLKTTRCLHVGSVSLSAEPARTATFQAVSLASGAGAWISCDVNYRERVWTDPAQARIQVEKIIERAHLLKVSEAEAGWLAERGDLQAANLPGLEAAARLLLERGPECVVITLGDAGSYYLTGEGGGFVPAFQVQSLDPVGCGDGFTAGLLGKLLSVPDWRRDLSAGEIGAAVRFGNAVGALTSQKLGAIPALPGLDQVERFLSAAKEGTGDD